MKKIRPIKNTWYNWLIDYIPEPIRKSVCDFKNKIVSLFETNTRKQMVYGREKKLRKLRKQNIKKPFIYQKWKKIKDRIIRDTQRLFETKEKEEKKESDKRKNQSERLINDRTIC